MIALHSEGRARVRTTVGIPPGRRPYESPIARKARLTAIRLRLAYGPFLSAFDAFGKASVIEARPRAYRVNGVLVRGNY